MLFCPVNQKSWIWFAHQLLFFLLFLHLLCLFLFLFSSSFIFHADGGWRARSAAGWHDGWCGNCWKHYKHWTYVSQTMDTSFKCDFYACVVCPSYHELNVEYYPTRILEYDCTTVPKLISHTHTHTRYSCLIYRHFLLNFSHKNSAFNRLGLTIGCTEKIK